MSLRASSSFLETFFRKIPTIVERLLLNKRQDEKHPAGAIVSKGGIRLDVPFAFRKVDSTSIPQCFPRKRRNGAGRASSVGTFVVQNSKAQLLYVVQALRSPRCLSGSLHGRQQ